MKGFENYELLHELGRGATASIWLSEKKDSGKKCCLKVFHPKIFSDQSSLHRVKREFQTLLKLHHPNIVQVYNLLMQSDPPALEMEYIDGENLEKFQCHLPYILPEVSVFIVIEILKALEYAHEQGIIHRDLKPENVLIGKSGKVLVSDFGLVRVEDGSTQLTMPNHIMGTIEYMSPEQARGETVTPASEIFSVGSILYYLVTGTSPFARGTRILTLQALQQEILESPEQRNPKLSGDLSRIILKALEKDSKNRFQTAKAFRLALENYLETVGLGEGGYTFARWIQDRSSQTREMLNASIESIGLQAEELWKQGNVPKLLEKLAHLSLKSPGNPLVKKLSADLFELKKKKWVQAGKALLLALAIGGVIALALHNRELNQVLEDTTALAVETAAAPIAEEKFGEVSIEVSSDTQVFWDGKEISERQMKQVPLGKHKLILKKKGFDPIEGDVLVTDKKPVLIKAR